MKKKTTKPMDAEERKQIVRELLDARGWLSCWFPIGFEMPEHTTLNGVRAGNLLGAIRKIDIALKALGYSGEVGP